MRILCIYHGMPLWFVANPPSTEKSVLLGGFLSAIDTFAREIGNTSISTMNMADSDWSFSKVHNQTDFFLVFQYPTSPDRDLARERQQLAQNLLTIVRTRFETTFPVAFFADFNNATNVFDHFQEQMQPFITHFGDILDRTALRDTVWLAGFQHAVKIFTAGLLGEPVFLIIQPSEDQTTTLQVRKFIATMEGLYYGNFPQVALLRAKIPVEFGFPQKNTIYLVHPDKLDLVPQDGCTVSLSERKAVSTQKILPMAEQMVKDLQQMAQNRISAVLEPLREVKECLNQISLQYPLQTLDKSGLRKVLMGLSPDLRDVVIAALEHKYPTL